MNIRETAPRITELEKISTRTDTRDYLAKAAPTREKLKDWLIVDVDAHVNETAFWSEVTERIDNEVLRYIAEAFRDRKGGPPGLLNANGPLYQDVAGRIMHQQSLAEPTPPGLHRQVQLTQRAMEAMGTDYMVVFPTPMLSLGMHPQIDAEVALGKAFNRWMVEVILPQDKRQMALLYLPFNDPEACVEVVEEFADKPGVVGFSIASTRHKPVWHNSYMRLYAALQEAGKPLGFHAGFTWGDPSFQQLNRFIGMHSLSFVHSNMKLTQATFEAMRAETQLLYASDWPHWDFDAPSAITKLPFLSEQAKRNILGLNAARLFNLEVPPAKSGKKARAEPVPVPAE